MTQLRPYQQDAIDAVRAYWRAGGENPLVEMATGTGKSLSLAGLTKGLLAEFPSLRVIVLVHVRELVSQDAMAMLHAWPGAPIGINSAGLGKRDRHSQILFASIQSVYKTDVGPRDLIIIDESHLVPRDGEGMYRTFLERLRQLTPDLRVVGFTATPYRTGAGRLDEGDNRLFSKIVYEYGIGKAIRDGFLSNLVSKAMATTFDISKVHVRGGEFVAKELEVIVNQDFVTKAAVKEIVDYGANRRAWIAFCTGVEHAEHVRDEIRRHGISCEMVSGTTPKGERDRILNAFKSGRIRCLTNCSVLTTGFDSPNIDMIALLRPTMSAGLFVQMVGRGTRLAEGKSDCLILDFAGNVRRHGPVDQITARTASSKSSDKDAVRAKECPECATLLHLGALECPTCGHSFRRDDDPLPKHDVRADAEHSILSTGTPTWIPVQSMSAYLHEKLGSPTSMRVEYFNGLATQREWICFAHTGFPRSKAVSWWQRMGGAMPTPSTAAEGIARLGEMARVEAIQVRPNGKFFDIVGVKVQRQAA
jgi:DNA repair protein RadD